MGTTYIIISIVSFVAGLFLMRLFGAWMLRIDEVIQLQKDILNELRRQRTSNSNEDISKPEGFVKPPKSGKRGGLLQRTDPNRKPL